MSRGLLGDILLSATTYLHFLCYVRLSLSTNTGTEEIVKLMIAINIYSTLNFILADYLPNKNLKIMPLKSNSANSH